MPVDLSQVLFIATANQLDTIPEPLYDRMEAIELSGYVVSYISCTTIFTVALTAMHSQHDEKLHIARQSLLPKQLRANALSPTLVNLPDDVLLHIITLYTREAGVRSLERHIGSVCRAKAVEYSEARDRDAEASTASPDRIPSGYKVEVTREDVERMLGPSRFDEDEGDRDGRVGVVNGLAYQGSGNGGILSECLVLLRTQVRHHLTLGVRRHRDDVDPGLGQVQPDGFTRRCHLRIRSSRLCLGPRARVRPRGRARAARERVHIAGRAFAHAGWGGQEGWAERRGRHGGGDRLAQ